MATTTTYSLRMKFKDDLGEAMQVTYPYADSNVTGATVKAAMQAMITNNEIFSVPPTTIVGAELVTSTVTDITIPS